MRINIGLNSPEWETAKRILCAIIQEAGGTIDGEVRLNKAFYWAHLAHWQKQAGVLSGYPMARLPYGPAIDRGENLLFELQADGLLKITEKKIAGVARPERRFKLNAGFKINMTDSEKESIRDGLQKIVGKSGKEVSDETHQTSVSWKRKRDGQILDIYEDLLSSEEFETAQQADREAKSVLDRVLG